MADCDNDQECEKIIPEPIKPEPLPKQCSGGDESGSGTSDFNELENRPKYGGRAMTGDTNIPEVETYEDFVGTDGEEDGVAGLVPAPAAADAGKFLKADGTWGEAGGSDINVVQTTGTSPDDVMSQNAVTSMIFADPENGTEVSIGNSNAGENAVSIGVNAYGTGQYSVALGDHSNTYGGQNAIAIGHSARARNTNAIAIGTNSNNGQDGGASSVAIGNNSHAGEESVTIGENAGNYTQNNTVSIGRGAQAWGRGSVAIGDQTTMDSTTSVRGTVSIKANSANYGYNGASNYRLLTGLYDGQNDHDAVNVGQINALIDVINTATGANISHIGA